MPNNKTPIIVLLLLLISFVSAEINIFSYSESQSPITILNNMNLAILDIEDQGYDSGRFVDIYNEAEYYIKTNENMFFETVSLFRNTTILADNTISQYKRLESELNVLNQLKKVNNSVLVKLNQANEYIAESKYESALSIFPELESYILTESEQLFVFVQQKFWDVEYEYNKLAITTHTLEDINLKLISAKKAKDILIAKEIIDELQDINVSVQHITAIKNHMLYFEDNSISTNKISDIYDESLYNFERKKYDKITSLYEESLLLYDEAVKYKQEYKKIHDKIGSLKDSDKKTEFETRLAASYELYTKSELDDAIEKLEKLNDNVSDYKLQIIAFTNINITQIPILDLIKENLVAVIGALIVIIILSIIVSMQVKRYMHVQKIKRYEKEKDNLEQMMKDLQYKYYDEKSISKKVYDSKMKAYQNRFVDVTRKLALMKNVHIT